MDLLTNTKHVLWRWLYLERRPKLCWRSDVKYLMPIQLEVWCMLCCVLGQTSYMMLELLVTLKQPRTCSLKVIEEIFKYLLGTSGLVLCYHSGDLSLRSLTDVTWGTQRWLEVHLWLCIIRRRTISWYGKRQSLLLDPRWHQSTQLAQLQCKRRFFCWGDYSMSTCHNSCKWSRNSILWQ